MKKPISIILSLSLIIGLFTICNFNAFAKAGSITLGGAGIESATIVYPKSEHSPYYAAHATTTYSVGEYDFGKLIAVKLQGVIKKYTGKAPAIAEENASGSIIRITVPKNGTSGSYSVSGSGSTLNINAGSWAAGWHCIDYIDNYLNSQSGTVNLANCSLSGTYDVFKIACIGDSITEGTTSWDYNEKATDNPRFCLSSYPSNLGRYLWQDCVVLNYGRQYGLISTFMTSTDTSNGVYSTKGRWDEYIKNAADYDLTIIAGGTNDLWAWGTSVGETDFRNAYIGMYNAIKAKNPNMMYVISNMPAAWDMEGGIPVNKELSYFKEDHYKAVAIRGIQKDVSDYIKGQGSKILYKDAYSFTKNEMGYSLFSDHCHPNDLGYTKLAKFYEGAVKELAPDLKSNSDVVVSKPTQSSSVASHSVYSTPTQSSSVVSGNANYSVNENYSNSIDWGKDLIKNSSFVANEQSLAGGSYTAYYDNAQGKDVSSDSKGVVDGTLGKHIDYWGCEGKNELTFTFKLNKTAKINSFLMDGNNAGEPYKIKNYTISVATDLRAPTVVYSKTNSSAIGEYITLKNPVYADYVIFKFTAPWYDYARIAELGVFGEYSDAPSSSSTSSVASATSKAPSVVSTVSKASSIVASQSSSVVSSASSVISSVASAVSSDNSSLNSSTVSEIISQPSSGAQTSNIQSDSSIQSTECEHKNFGFTIKDGKRVKYCKDCLSQLEATDITLSESAASTGYISDTIVESNPTNGTISKPSILKAPSKSKFSVKLKKHKVKLSLKKIKGASKLQYRYKIKGKKWSKTYTKSNKNQIFTVKGLKKKKTYLFAIRYKKNGKYSKWSKTRKVKIK